MSLMRPLSSMRSDMERLFSEMERDLMIPLRSNRPADFFDNLTSTWTPAVNISEDEKNISITASIPGIKPEDIDVEVVGNQLTLSGGVKQESEDTGLNYHRREIIRGRFHRQVQLPMDVDGDKADAKFEHGMLHVTIPKSQSTKRHHIKIHK